jgi:5-enolpyruvylshikimate-3-phosphate synthase
MTFSIVSMLLENGGEIDYPECINVSNPDFFNQIKLVTYN